MKMPPELFKLLTKERFCSLATSHRDHPHVFLMVFTFLEEEGLIILSSRADTSKVRHMQNNPAVSILLYTLGGDGEPPLSCTLYGTAEVLHPDRDRYYRERHYRNHQEMGQFILGEQIAVIAVRIHRAALSDVEDSVQTWSSGESATGDT